MTAVVRSVFPPPSQAVPLESADWVREYMREIASQVDLEIPMPEQRGFIIGDVRL